MRDPARASPRRRALLTLGLCALVIVVWWAMRVPAPPPPAVPFGPGDTLSGQVLWVVNGTTIQVALGGGHERVAYLGIEALGPSATEANRHLVQGQRVRLELDAPLRDGEGRLLAYVYVGDLMVNAELVRLGYAQVATVPPHGKYQELLLTRQREAWDAKRGMGGITLQEWSLVQAPLARPAITHGSRQLLIAEESGSRHEASTGGEADAA